jgi:hypothetical protein
MTMKLTLPIAIMIAVIGAVPAIAAAPAVSVPVGPIDQFVGTTRTLYFQTRGDWYEAHLAKSCFELPDVNHMRIATGPDQRFDGSSTVLVHRERCPVASVTRVDGPPQELLLNGEG